MRFLRLGLTIVVVAAVVFYGLVCGILFAFQRSLIYFPQPRSNRAASASMTFAVGGETVEASARPLAGPDALLYFGGNAEDVSQAVPELVEAFPGRAIYALHYPGYGGSSGAPSERAIFADALALFDRVSAEHSRIVIIGRSLGSSVGVWVASRRPVARLVLVTPFDSLGDAAAAQHPYLPVRWLLRDRFESGRYAPMVTAPTRIVVAGDDGLVPRSSSERLRTRFREGVASYVVVPGAGHNTIQEYPGYWSFLKSE